MSIKWVVHVFHMHKLYSIECTHFGRNCFVCHTYITITNNKVLSCFWKSCCVTVDRTRTLICSALSREMLLSNVHVNNGHFFVLLFSFFHFFFLSNGNSFCVTSDRQKTKFIWIFQMKNSFKQKIEFGILIWTLFSNGSHMRMGVSNKTNFFSDFSPLLDNLWVMRGDLISTISNQIEKCIGLKSWKTEVVCQFLMVLRCSVLNALFALV